MASFSKGRYIPHTTVFSLRPLLLEHYSGLFSEGGVVRIKGDEFWHMTKVLRLSTSDRVELFNGKGGLIEGCMQSVDRSGLDIIALEDPRIFSCRPHSGKSLRLLEIGWRDCSVSFLLLLSNVGQSKLSFVASAEAPPLISTPTSCRKEPFGSLIIGPEGDFTEKEVELIKSAGVTSVGVGPHCLRVETATIALLATVMLWSDSCSN